LPGILVAALAIIVLALAITLGVERNQNNPTNPDQVTMNNDTTTSSDICLTVECVELSSQISSSLDPSIDPCEDFYQFSCKGFRDEAIIPFGRS